MKKIILLLSIFGIITLIVVASLMQREMNVDNQTKLKSQYSKKIKKKVDHSKFAVLQQKFSNPQQVTQACLTCHNMTAHQVMNSNHWNWEREEYIEGRGIVYLGKKNAINNFCIGSNGNEKSCAKCHVGLGYDSKGQLFSDSSNIDCMICHDNTETYAKASEMAGAPERTLNFNEIAFSSGKPTRNNCGVCHFFGGGGNNVKHGDLDKAMFDGTKDIDIHMGTDGGNLQCIDCHKTEQHNISGKMYSLSSMNHNRSSCEQCHTANPHKDDIINEHNLKVSCQACHIPTYAKANSTKMYWDWSTAGKLRNGEPYHEEDSLGNHTYLSIKGSFKWDRNIKPDYIWFNGTADHYLKGDIVKDDSKPVELNKLNGSYADDESKIIPTKIHLGKQPYDPVNKIMIYPKLFADKKGEGAFWQDFDWQRAAEVGMQEANLPYSGKIDFIETKMYWPVNHMVSSKEEALSCNDCHTRNDSRIKNLKDFYLPGRDYNATIDTMAYIMMILAILGIGTHAALRYIGSRNKAKENQNV